VAQTQIFLIAAGLTIATLLLVAGSVALASIVAAVVAVVAALGATGVWNAAAELRRRGK
jgi:phage-related minor tail protein